MSFVNHQAVACLSSSHKLYLFAQATKWCWCKIWLFKMLLLSDLNLIIIFSLNGASQFPNFHFLTSYFCSEERGDMSKHQGSLHGSLLLIITSPYWISAIEWNDVAWLIRNITTIVKFHNRVMTVNRLITVMLYIGSGWWMDENNFIHL